MLTLCAVVSVSSPLVTSLRRVFCCSALRYGAAIGVSALAVTRSAGAGSDNAPRWCAPELEMVDDACFFGAEDRVEPTTRRTLVVFLHSLVGAGTQWQWEQQRALVRAARHNGFSVLMPRGRLGIGPGRAPDVWAWPTARETQRDVEDEIVAQWEKARTRIEGKRGPFDAWFVFGFSNGAYYAASLALRGRLDADGYGVFAGGSARRGAERRLGSVSHRPPIFVGYGEKDAAREDPKSLARALSRAGWPHVLEASRVGHTVTDRQLDRAFVFLTAKSAPKHNQR